MGKKKKKAKKELGSGDKQDAVRDAPEWHFLASLIGSAAVSVSSCNMKSKSFEFEIQPHSSPRHVDY